MTSIPQVSNLTPGIPADFTGFTECGEKYIVQAGVRTRMRVRPMIVNEHQEEADDILATVTASNLVGQIFKASQDNINTISMTLESAVSVYSDNFEGYADSAALQAVWPVTGTNAATLETTIVSSKQSSTKSMRMMLDVLNDEWKDTFAAVDMTGGTINFDYRQSDKVDKATVDVLLSDGTLTNSITINVSNKDIWESFSIPVSALTGTANVAAITSIAFKVTLAKAGKFGYVDNLVLRPDTGSINVGLWDMGTSIPVSGTTNISDGTQYTTIGDLGFGDALVATYSHALDGGARQYHIHLKAGCATEESTNTVLTAGNYYAIVLYHVDTDVNVCGIAESKYTNGYGFTAPPGSTLITQIGAGHDLQFEIYSTQQAYLTKAEITWDASPDFEATVTLKVEDESEGITTILDLHEHGPENPLEIEPHRGIIMEKGSKLEAYYNDSLDDSVSKGFLEMEIAFVPPTING